MLGKPHPEQDRVGGSPARPGAGGPPAPSGRSLDPPGNRGTRRMAAAPAFWAGGQNPAYRPPPAGGTPPGPAGTPRESRQKATLTVRAAGVYTAACCGAKWGLVVEPRVVW